LAGASEEPLGIPLGIDENINDQWASLKSAIPQRGFY
jgi:hypothetical protein